MEDNTFPYVLKLTFVEDLSPMILHLIDDGFGEAKSDPISIYVTSTANPPTAAFKTEMAEGDKGLSVQFINNSTFDEEQGASASSFVWDFNTMEDSNGDAITDNDIDSELEAPIHSFDTEGTYQVKLTILDNQGAQSEVVNSVTVPLADPPVAAFNYEIDQVQ